MIFLAKKNVKRLLAVMRALAPQPPASKAVKDFAVRILMYHSVGGKPSDHRLAVRVPVERFEAQLKELRGLGYVTVTVSEAIAGGLDTEPDRAVALTFDDGYKDNFTTAAPLLRSMGMKATFFITTAHICGKARQKWADGSPREYMGWEDVKALAGMGFEIGSHMIDHVDLTSLSDTDLKAQLELSRQDIARNLGKAPDVMSYPYGKLDERVIAMAGKAGYKAACSSFAGLNCAATNPCILRRTEIDGYDTINDFRSKLAGLYD